MATGPTSASEGVRSPPVSRTESGLPPRPVEHVGDPHRVGDHGEVRGCPPRCRAKRVGGRPGGDRDRRARPAPVGRGLGGDRLLLGLRCGPTWPRSRAPRSTARPPRARHRGPSRADRADAAPRRSRRTVMSETPSRSTRSATRRCRHGRARPGSATVAALPASRPTSFAPTATPPAGSGPTQIAGRDEIGDRSAGTETASSVWLSTNSHDASPLRRRCTSTPGAERRHRNDPGVGDHPCDEPCRRLDVGAGGDVPGDALADLVAGHRGTAGDGPVDVVDDSLGAREPQVLGPDVARATVVERDRARRRAAGRTPPRRSRASRGRRRGSRRCGCGRRRRRSRRSR